MTTSIDGVNSEVREMQPLWEMVDALAGGTKKMREAGTKFLPMEPRESATAYANRLNRTVLFEGYKRAVDTLVGRPLMETVSFTDDMAEDVQEWLNDANLQGDDINVFTREVFHSAMHHGLSHIFVDYPRTGGRLSLYTERKEKIRPYFVHLSAKDVFAWRTMRAGHRDILTHVRFKRQIQRQDGEWGLKTVTQIYVLDRNYDHEKQEHLPEPSKFVLLRIYEQSEKGEWELVEEPEVLTISEIPLVTVYTNKKGFMFAEPAFLGVAYLNVAHWQSSSDQRNILHVCRVPLLFGRHLAVKTNPEGDEDLLEFEIGPNRMILSEEDNSDLKFVEHTGNAIKAGAEDLDNIKDEMAMLALEVMTKRSGTITATEKSIDTAAANGTLVGMIRSLQSGLNKALTFAGMWINRTDMGMMDINTDFRIAIDNADLEVLMKARINGDLSVETYWNEALRRGVLSEDFDAEQEKERIKKEREENDLPPPPPSSEEEEEEVEETE